MFASIFFSLPAVSLSCFGVKTNRLYELHQKSRAVACKNKAMSWKILKGVCVCVGMMIIRWFVNNAVHITDNLTHRSKGVVTRAALTVHGLILSEFI